jgi:RNA polymerase sigma-70 factor (ECF subfamily)
VYALEPGPLLLTLGTPEQGAEARVDSASTSVPVPSFAEVFRTYSGFVWRVLLRLGVAESDVDDVAQEVFLGVHRNLSSFEGRCALRTWVYGICHRRAIDYRRRAMTRPETPTDEVPDVGTEASQDEGLDLGRARAQLQQLLENLDEEKRAVFVLFEVEGIPMEEVAEIVGCPLQTAYSRLYAARKKVDALAQRMRAQRRSP